ncbi:MAG: GntR family transcriptional regulator [Chloroflexota bacterium]|nr:GntR family transcriptional regulator [Chloroflexota bacterium]
MAAEINREGFSPFDRLGDVAYASVRGAIVGREVRGDAVLREADLVRQLGISRTPVREALRRLEAEGLIAGLPRGGYRVVEWDSAELAQAYAVRIALEGLSVRLAAEGRNAVHLAQLGSALEDLRAATARRDEELPRLNSALHMTIADAGGNAFLRSTLSDILEIFHRHPAAERTLASRRARALAEHAALVRAIERRDADRAERLMRKHLETGRTSVVPSRKEAMRRAHL